MNDYLLAALLGVVEGLTEFLPVSSTAHIRLTFAAVGGDLHDAFWKMFTVVIQLPAILAVVVYLRPRIVEFVRSFFAGGITREKLLRHPVALVLIATIVTAIPAKLLKKLIKGNLESIYVMGGALVVGGILMWVIDRWASQREARERTETSVADAAKLPRVTSTIEQMSLTQSIWIGAVQILSAVFPGTSRSMATIAGGQLAGLTRPAALEFSFFLSIPIMCLACASDLLESLKAAPGDASYVGAMTSARWLTLAIGSVVSFVVALGVIAWFMAWVRRRGLTPFAVYRIVVGAAVLGWAYRVAHGAS